MVPLYDFAKLDLRVGTITQAVPVEESDKLIKLQVNLGGETRQILAGIKKFYQPDELKGKQIVIIANLEYKKMMGEESQGMLLAADIDGKPVLLKPDSEVPPGTQIR